MLGGGANGRVFLAEDLQLGRPVALKVFALSAGEDDRIDPIEQAIREAKLAAGLDHPHIVHVYEVNETAVATILRASDFATLKRLAIANDPGNPTQVVVEGIVSSNQASKHAKYFRIGFSGSDESNDFSCIYKPELLPNLQSKFGSADGLGLTGKRVRITGHLEMFKDRPTIKIDAADRIDVVK